MSLTYRYRVTVDSQVIGTWDRQTAMANAEKKSQVSGTVVVVEVFGKRVRPFARWVDGVKKLDQS